MRCGWTSAWVQGCCLAAALLLACAWLGTRFAIVDLQTGTPLAISLDQGMAIFVVGEAPLDAGIDVSGHDSDQVAWQWWFATYPHSILVPLWVPMALCGLLWMLVRPRDALAGSPRDSAPASIAAGTPH